MVQGTAHSPSEKKDSFITPRERSKRMQDRMGIEHLRFALHKRVEAVAVVPCVPVNTELTSFMGLGLFTSKDGMKQQDGLRATFASGAPSSICSCCIAYLPPQSQRPKRKGCFRIADTSLVFGTTFSRASNVHSSSAAISRSWTSTESKQDGIMTPKETSPQRRSLRLGRFYASSRCGRPWRGKVSRPSRIKP